MSAMGWTIRGVLKYAQGPRGLEDAPSFVRVTRQLESEGLIELRTRTEAQYLADVLDEELDNHFHHYPYRGKGTREVLKSEIEKALWNHVENRSTIPQRKFKTWHLTEKGLEFWLKGGGR